LLLLRRVRFGAAQFLTQLCKGCSCACSQQRAHHLARARADHLVRARTCERRPHCRFLLRVQVACGLGFEINSCRTPSRMHACVCWCVQGSLLASGSQSGHVNVFSVAPGTENSGDNNRPEHSIELKGKFVLCVAYRLRRCWNLLCLCMECLFCGALESLCSYARSYLIHSPHGRAHAHAHASGSRSQLEAAQLIAQIHACAHNTHQRTTLSPPHTNKQSLWTPAGYWSSGAAVCVCVCVCVCEREREREREIVCVCVRVFCRVGCISTEDTLIVCCGNAEQN
jgi:hypothetical protein